MKPLTPQIKTLTPQMKPFRIFGSLNLPLYLFRGQCKPTWLFLSGGEPVAVMHGANAPLLQKMIEKEIRKEKQVLKGEAVRDTIALEDAVPGKNTR